LARKFFYLARKAPALLPSGYRLRQNTKVEGRAKTGEISKQGLVAHTEDWDGRLKASAAPAAIRYIKTSDGVRPMTMQEMIERGYFIVGKGPKGVRNVKT
jgi:hypothetical protein